MEQVHLKFCFSNKKKLKQTLVSSIFFLLSSVGERSHLPYFPWATLWFLFSAC